MAKRRLAFRHWARTWDNVSRHPFWSALLAGLVLAILGGAWTFVNDLGGGEPRSELPCPDVGHLAIQDGPKAAFVSTASSEAGQIQGGDILRARVAGDSISPVDPILARAGQELEFSMRVVNSGPGTVLGIRLQASLVSSTTHLVIRATISAINADPEETSDTVTINLEGPDSACAEYVPGSTRVRRFQDESARQLPDGVFQGGIALEPIDELLSDAQLVWFRVRLRE
jgi:hypothetical protein